jgi:hypothetical protein
MNGFSEVTLLPLVLAIPLCRVGSKGKSITAADFSDEHRWPDAVPCLCAGRRFP